MPSHSHNASSDSNGGHTHSIIARTGWTSGNNIAGAADGSTNKDKSTGSNGSHSHTITVNSNGGSTAHNNIQPYLAVYYWKRTA